MKRSLVLLAVVPLAATLLAGCGVSASDDGRTTIVASFYPFAYVAGQVGGSFVNVDNLTSPGVEPHDLELKPKQVGAVQDADLVVYEKHFQSAVDDAVAQAGRSSSNIVDVGSVLSPKPAQVAVAQGHDDEHGDEHGVQEDPHTWLDPQNMMTVTNAVAEKLAAIDPGHATAYRENAAALVTKLDALDADFATGLKTCRTRTIVTSHAAFQYLAARYDLTQVPIAGLDPTNEPSTSQLADITKLVRQEKITTIFTEELVSPAIARTVADETGVTTATLDPIEGLSSNTSDQTYLTLMARNLEALKKANSCR